MFIKSRIGNLDMDLINSLFGKEDGITEEDIHKTIIEPKKKEGQKLEYKGETVFKGEKAKEKREKSLIKPLVAFLNTIEGKGLLVLGINDEKHGKQRVPTGITPIPSNQIRNESALRSWIHEYIRSVPHYGQVPELKIVSVPIKKTGNVFLIEIESKDTGCLYYSTISGLAYERKNDESKPLDLHKSIEIVHKKASPKVFIFLEETKSKRGIGYRVILVNDGVKPGRNILGVVHIYHSENVVVEMTGVGIRKRRMLPKKGKVYQITSGTPPSTHLIYPKAECETGLLLIRGEGDFDIHMLLRINERMGYTKQEIKLEKRFGNVVVTYPVEDFFPYISI